MDAEEFLRQGIAAARARETKKAQGLLVRAVRQDPSLIDGWWWLANILEDANQRRDCLKRVLALDPTHPGARARMEREAASTDVQEILPPAAAPSRPYGQQTAPEQAASPRAEAGSRAPVRAKSSGPSTGLIIAVAMIAVLFVAGALAVVFLSGMMDGFLEGLSPESQSGDSAANLVVPTLPPTWTPTPSLTPAPSPIVPPTPESTPQPTIPTPGDQRFAVALRMMEGGNYDGAINLWGAIIADDPQNHYAFFQRATSYLKLVPGLTSLDMYANYSREALSDTDQAINLSPDPVGDYYIARSYAFEDLSNVAVNLVDQDRLAELSLENQALGVSLPHTNPIQSYGIPQLQFRIGQCDEALREAERLDQERGSDLAPVPALEYVKAISLTCRGRYPEAIQHIDLAFSVLALCDYQYQRAVAEYHMGRPDEALLDLNTTIETCPAGAGYRYYLRGLIEYEQGSVELAMQDLFVGSLNTWAQDGLKAYVEARIMLDQGQRESGIERMRDAERTMDRSHGPFPARIRSELLALGGQPEDPLPLTVPEATPIPPLPEGHPVPPTALHLRYAQGSDAVTISPGEALMVYFAPPSGFTQTSVLSMEIHVLAEQRSGETGLELEVFSTKSEQWESFGPNWGSNAIPSPKDFVLTSGTVIIQLTNLSTETIAMDNIGLVLVVRAVGGKTVTYSFLEG